MARVRNHCNCSRAAALIWTSSALLLILILRAAMRNSIPSDAGTAVLSSERRSRLYDKMARDLDEHGATFLRGGETSQSLSLSDIFDLRDGVVAPRLKAADPPVRATVLYLSTEFSEPLSIHAWAVKLVLELGRGLFIVWTTYMLRLFLLLPLLFFRRLLLNYGIDVSAIHRTQRLQQLTHSSIFGRIHAVREIFLPYFSGVTWFQNTSLYHFSMFHASHHITPINATDDEIEAEANAVKGVASALCPLNIVLDRVILTSTGVLLGCWQVTLGTDPLAIRAKLRNALPHAPKNQLYDQVMLHTSFARLLGHPKIPAEGVKEPSDQLDFFHKLVTQINNKICGFQSTVSEIWFVEEYDVLALALNGRMKARRFHLDCAGN